ncbi:hypothetical protein [Pseudomonas mucidolens]|uniref:hypothetical protein n=1 Tax=Pseudomonas mucidolens TaxID=46679 RepID=UPI0030DB3973
MLTPINSSGAHINAWQADSTASTRKKRSIEEQPRTIDFSGTAANDRRKSSGTLDSLGRGNLL